MLSKECRAQRISSSQAGGVRWDGAGSAGDQVQGFGAHKQPSPLDSRHFLSGGAIMESRLQLRLVQGIWTWRLKLELNAMPSTSPECSGRKMLLVSLWSVWTLSKGVGRERNQKTPNVCMKSFPELRDVGFKLSLFILLNTRGNGLWFKFSAGQVI